MISSSEASRLGSDSNIRILESSGSMVAYVFFNMRRSPCDDQEFRAALARIVNREYICKTLGKDAVSPLLTFVSQTSGEWVNNDAVAPDFNSVEATRILDDSGYVLDSETGWRINPNTGKILEITIVTPNRSDASILWDTGYTINYYANAMGIRSTHLSMPMGQFLARTMQDRDFDVIVQFVPLERIPFGLYVMLDSSRDINGTSAYSGAKDEALDSDLKMLWTGISELEVRQAAHDAQTRLMAILPCVPIYSTPTLSALRSEWAESVTVSSLGVDNLWTYLSVHPVTQLYGGTLTKSVLGNVTTLNPCLANSSIDWGVKLYQDTLTKIPFFPHPYILICAMWFITVMMETTMKLPNATITASEKNWRVLLALFIPF